MDTTPFSRKTRSLALAAVLLPTVWAGSASATEKIVFSKTERQVGTCPMTLELAVTPAQTARGLMFRETLADDHGMFFALDGRGGVWFWMKNTLIDLDIAFMDENGRTLAIEEMFAGSLDRVGAPDGTRYAIEVNPGTFEACGVQVGDILPIPVR